MTLDILVRMNSIGYAVSPESDSQQFRGSRAYFPKLFYALGKPMIRGAVIGAVVGYAFSSLTGDGTHISDGALFGAGFSESFFISSQCFWYK